MFPKKLFAILSLALFASAAASPSRAQQSVRELLEADVRFLSDTTCTGRGSSTRGFVEASAYVARRLAMIPGMEAGGADGKSWFSSFTLPDGRAGHNVLGILPPASLPKSPRYVLVIAALDGRGTMNGVVYPGADSNASGVAAGLAIASRLADSPARQCGFIFAFLDGHHSNNAGACALLKQLKLNEIRTVVNLDIIGSSLSPVVKYKKDYLIALGGSYWSRTLEKINGERNLDLHITYDYYGSRDFTNLFYRKVGDHKPFLDKGLQSVVFTSGITMLTNKSADTFDTLNYPLMEKRAELISLWLSSLSR